MTRVQLWGLKEQLDDFVCICDEIFHDTTGDEDAVITSKAAYRRLMYQFYTLEEMRKEHPELNRPEVK